MLDLTEDEAVARARERMSRTGRVLGVAVRRSWLDRRDAPLGDGVCAKVVISDGERAYTPQTAAYVERARLVDHHGRPSWDDAELENELELLAKGWPRATQAEELALAVDEDRLIRALEPFGLGERRG